MGHATGPIWIDPSWLSWESYSTSSHHLDDTSSRLYQVHQHASDRLTSDPNEFDRVDAITTLRRVVGRRVKALKEIYHLRELPIGTKPKYDLELLEYFGIIRPYMLKRLIDIRNIVEHQDSAPPPTDECLMFADLVWYFLRSTDGLVKRIVEELLFVDSGMPISDRAPRTILRFRKPLSEPPGITAYLQPGDVAYEPRRNWIRIEATNIGPQDYYFDGENRFVKEAEPIRMHFIGDIKGTTDQMRLIYELYFRTHNPLYHLCQSE
jgi:hypothetical protein